MVEFYIWLLLVRIYDKLKYIEIIFFKRGNLIEDCIFRLESGYYNFFGI